MLYCMEIYDILFFDWFLLCHSNFFPHFYPELKGIVGPHMFGYNKRSHLLHFLLYIPLCAESLQKLAGPGDTVCPDVIGQDRRQIHITGKRKQAFPLKRPHVRDDQLQIRIALRRCAKAKTARL